MGSLNVGVGLVGPRKRGGDLNLSFVRNEDVLGADISYLGVAISSSVGVLLFSSTQGVEEMPEFRLIETGFFLFVGIDGIVEDKGIVVVGNLRC